MITATLGPKGETTMPASDGVTESAPRRRWPRTPATMLVLLSPLIGEVLNGATRVSVLFVFGLQVMIWGCGALLIREVVQRWGGGLSSVIALGLALSAFVELLVLQTSLAPIPFLSMASIPVYDRIWGVNWLWFVFMLGYETVWIVLVPILIVELRFPELRNGRWLQSRGLLAAALALAVGSVILWALWTHITVPVVFHQPKYQPPSASLMVSVIAVIALVAIGFALRRVRDSATPLSNWAASPWVVGAVTAIFALPWWILIVLVFAPQRALPLWVPLLGGSAWAVMAWLVIHRLSRASAWCDRHRWALAFSALAVCMLAGYLGSASWSKLDLAGKIVLNVIATERMIALARFIWRRHEGA